MKTTGRISLISLCWIAACTGAEPDSRSIIEERSGPASIEFSFAMASAKSSPDAKALQDAVAVLVTIEDSGTPIYSLERVDLVPFGTTFLSQPLSLLPGSYELTSFALVDAADQVIYATPLSGSNIDHLVVEPLPIAFAIATDTVTTIRPQVVTTEELTPEDFGYVSFGLDDTSVIDIVDFLVAAFVFDDGSQSLVLADANIAVDNEIGVELYSGVLTADTNQIRVPAGQVQYDITVSKSGYLDWQSSFTEVEIASYFASSSQGPLEVVLSQDVDPDPFVFADVRLRDIDTSENSNTVTVTGFTGQLMLALTGAAGATIVHNGVDTGQNSVTVQPGDSAAVNMSSASTFETVATVSVSLGNYATDWSITTAPDCPAEATRLSGSRGCVFAGGASYAFTVPAIISDVEVKLWGAGGGGGAPPLSGPCTGANGGGGGFASGVVAVTPGESLDFVVGSGGGDGVGGGGGGRTEIERAGLPLYVAGGGGGGSHCEHGLPGGGLSGGGGPADDGVCANCGCAGPGTGFGGFGGGAPGSHIGGVWHNGGGGGGYTGGQAYCSSDTRGGGGSGFVAGGESGATQAGTGATPAGTGDPEYSPDIGQGGSPVTDGGDGQLIVLWR